MRLLRCYSTHVWPRASLGADAEGVSKSMIGMKIVIIRNMVYQIVRRLMDAARTLPTDVVLVPNKAPRAARLCLHVVHQNSTTWGNATS